MIAIPCIALVFAACALIYVIRSGREIKKLQRQTWADISLTQIRNSSTRYYLQRQAELQARRRWS